MSCVPPCVTMCGNEQPSCVDRHRTFGYAKSSSMKPQLTLKLVLMCALNCVILVGCVGLRQPQGQPPPPPTGSLKNLNHIIIFAQENRSFDHYFGALRQYWAANGIADQSFDGLPQFNPASGIAPLQGPAPTNAGCDPTQPYPPYTACAIDTNVMIPSFHFTSMCQEEQSPFWDEAHVDWDYNAPTGTGPAALNGFVWTAADDARQQSPTLMDTDGIRAMGYFDGGDLNYYYFMASNFATSDRWFSPVMDRTQINRMYLLAATSAGHARPLVAPETPLSVPVIFEELQTAGITWKIYIDPRPNCSSNPV